MYIWETSSIQGTERVKMIWMLYVYASNPQQFISDFLSNQALLQSSNDKGISMITNHLIGKVSSAFLAFLICPAQYWTPLDPVFFLKLLSMASTLLFLLSLLYNCCCSPWSLTFFICVHLAYLTSLISMTISNNSQNLCVWIGVVLIYSYCLSFN